MKRVSKSTFSWLLVLTYLLIFQLDGLAQTKCKDLSYSFNVDPEKLLLDSLSNFANQSQIDQLRKESLLLFSYKIQMKTFDLSELRMEYFYDDLLSKSKPLEKSLIRAIEKLFINNLKIELDNSSALKQQAEFVQCSLIIQLE